MQQPAGICTFLIIGLSCVTSYLGFRSQTLEEKYIFRPEAILAWKEYYRLLTSAFLHANWTHLTLNMVSLYLFGGLVEVLLGPLHFLLIYLGAVVGGSLLSLCVHRQHDYRAYGASGGVCGIIFAYVLMFPGAGVQLFVFPVSVPGWLYVIGFMLWSFFGMKSNRDNIGHDAHLGGAVIGFLLAAGLHPWMVRNNPGIFLLMLAGSLLVLVYLWVNPLWLPLAAVFHRGRTGGRARKSRAANAPPAHRQEALELDAISRKNRQTGNGEPDVSRKEPAR
jgi:membrane associated rhomboid family serine protease